MHLPKFFKRPAHTLLYITEAKTFRIDTDRRGVINGDILVIDCPCESANAIPGCLDSIFNDSTPKPGRKVWLLYARLTTYALTLPSVQIEGVDNAILEQALQFEFEGLTGQSVSNSFLAHQYIGAADEMSTYWINLVAKETLTKTKEILKKKHCSFAGLTHPGGLPFLISGTESPSWLRIECWSDSVFALAKTPELGLSLQIFHTAQNPKWQDEVDHWVLDTGAVDKSEAIMNNKIEYLPNTDENYRLSLDGALVFWLGLWAKHLVADDTIDVPLLNPQKSVNKDLLFMAGGGITAALLCAGHFTWNLYLRNDFQFQTEALSKAEKYSLDLRKNLNTERDKANQLRQETALVETNIDSIPLAIAGLQQRPVKLLLTLANNTPADLVIEQIEQEDDAIIISGVSLLPQLVNQLTSAIEADVIALGWKPSTPTKKDMAIFAQGGPWNFIYKLQDMGLEGFINNGKAAP